MRLFPLNLFDRWLAPVPDWRKVEWITQTDFAHRGVHGSAGDHGAERVENSLSAFAAAMDRGLGIECDVRRSSDGRAMVFHDRDLDRLTDQAGPIAARSSKILTGLNLAGSEDRILALRDLLVRIAGRVPVLIELKSDRETRVPALCLSVRRVLEGYVGPHAVMSFDPRVSRWFFTHSPHTVRGLIVSEEDDKAILGSIRRQMALWHARPDFLAYDIRDLPSRFASAHRHRGLPIATWTVRSAQHLERARAHADAAIAEGEGLPSDGPA
ncbi:glycerophosphodiester phosphodiesterase family protein [Novosphingobium aquimarinum]|uniref:glycerophosphodiester phosphodiesterase family protein n=1 Tax=Novosphingobium aquimarinum TaxID=2682494 RepID=UPI0012EB4931|nr:glycerophosphodiester phosphodiesterase family protein [Novosphingobium aquimarinum]